MSMPHYTLPNLLRNWPWRRSLSEHYTDVKKESGAWVQSFRPFGPVGQKTFNGCDFSLLACLSCSHRSKEFLRVSCDLINFYFVYDEYTDVSDKSVAGQLARVVIDAFQKPCERPSNEHILGEMMRQFWQRANTLASPGSSCFRHFLATFEAYLHGVTQEAEDLAHKRIRTVDDYLKLRKHTGGGWPTLALVEFGLDLPDEVLQHPTIVSLADSTVIIMVSINDMHSYIRELACGSASHNIITSIMHEHGLDRQAAFNWLGHFVDKLISRFLSDLEMIPSWGEAIDIRVRCYINGLGQWVRGLDDWSTESKRYYGNKGSEIRERRIVHLGPVIGPYLDEDQLMSIS